MRAPLALALTLAASAAGAQVAPLPAAPAWVSHAWFPRVAYLGFLPADRTLPIAEVTLGALPQSLLAASPGQTTMDLGFANGAPAGLQLPHLNGDQTLALTNLHRARRAVLIHLPGDRPALWTDGRKGKRGDTTPVIHTLVIEPDEDRLSIVWRGSCPALRPYTADELATMPVISKPKAATEILRQRASRF